MMGKTDLFPRADRLVGEAPQLTTAAPALGTVVENTIKLLLELIKSLKPEDTFGHKL